MTKLRAKLTRESRVLTEDSEAKAGGKEASRHRLCVARWHYLPGWTELSPWVSRRPPPLSERHQPVASSRQLG